MMVPLDFFVCADGRMLNPQHIVFAELAAKVTAVSVMLSDNSVAWLQDDDAEAFRVYIAERSSVAMRGRLQAAMAARPATAAQ